MGIKPLYVIRLEAGGYYAAESAWKPVAKEEATKLTHKDARRI